MTETNYHLAGPIIFALLTVTLGVIGVQYGSIWAQELSSKAFIAACTSFQVAH